MLDKNELAGLRKDGLSDDAILGHYREYNPTFNADIDGLQKDGISSRDILDGLTEYKAPAASSTKKDDSFLGAARHGVGAVASGVGKTLRANGYTNVGPLLEGAGAAIAPRDYDDAASKVQWNSPSTWSYIPRALVEGAPGAAVDVAGGLAGGAVGGPAGFVAGSTAAHTARSYGDNLDDRMRGQGKTLGDATGGDQAAALAGSAAEGALGAVGIKGAGGALSSVTKGAGMKAIAQLPGQIVGAGVRDGVANAAGNVANQVGRTIGTDNGLSIDATEAANAGALGAGGGMALRGVRGVGDVYQSTRMRGLTDDTQSSTRVADSILSHELDVSDPKQAKTALDLTERQLHRANREAGMPAYLKEVDTETRTSVNDALDRLRQGQALTDAQLSTLSERLSNDPTGQVILNNVTDLHTLAKVKGMGEVQGGEFGRAGLAGSALGRLTNPFSRLGVTAGGAVGAGSVIPAIAQSAAFGHVAAAAPWALGAGAAIQGGLRGADRLLGTRQPLAEFTTRFEGLDRPAPSAEPSLPAFAPRGEDTGIPEAAWRRMEAIRQAEALAQVRRDGQVDRAWASRELDPAAKAAQEEGMWRQRDEAQARSQSEDVDASDGIAEGYRKLAAQAQAMQVARASQEAQARAQVDAQNAAEARLSASRSRDFDRAQAQLPTSEISARAKAAQVAAMYKAQAAQERAQAAPRGWDDADAVAAIRGAQQASQAQSDAIIRGNAIERAAANPIPVDEVMTAQPKAQAKPKDKAKEAKKSEGDSFELDGIDHPIPDNVTNRAGYIKSIKRKQGQIDDYIRRAQDDGFIAEQTDNAISDLRTELKTARNKKQARETVERMANRSSSTDRQHILRTFDSDFLNIWSKDE